MTEAARRGLLGVLLALSAGLASCAPSEENGDPKPDDVVCRIGPATFTEAALNRWIGWSQQRDAALSPAKIRRITITDFLLPRTIAQAMAGETRIAEARARADRFYEALVATNGDLESFRKIAKLQNVRLSDDEEFVRPFNMLPLDMSQTAFETEVGSHSGVLESKLGFSVVAVVARKFDVMERRQLLIAEFPYDPDVKFGETVKKASIELLSEKAWAHPRYRNELESIFRNLSEEWPPAKKTKDT